MTLKDQFTQNKPLVYSVLSGLIYLLMHASMDFGGASVGILLLLLIVLPGITFPLTTAYYDSGNTVNSLVKKIIHFVLSLAIYLLIFLLFYMDYTEGGTSTYLIIFAGLFGSLLFQVLTKYLLKKEITWVQIIITATLSGLVLLPFLLFGRHGVLLGLAVFLWITINGFLLNAEYKKTTFQNK